MEDAGNMVATVSVIIVNYNGRHLLQDCLASLEAQTFRDFEACVVDNGSSDGSAEFVRSRFPRVRVLALGENLGFCGGNNVAIKSSRSELVALLNNDTRVVPGWLEELVRGMRAHPEAGICASRVLFIDQPDVLYAAGDAYSAWGVPFMRGYRMPAAGNFEEPGETFSACACAALYRRRMLEEIGLLDEDLFMCAEDVDLGFRGRLAGYTCRYVPGAVVCHHGGGTQGVGNAHTEFLTSRNYESVFFKDMPGALLLRYLPFHLLYICWGLVQSWKHGLTVPYLKGKVAFLAALFSVLRKRLVVQRTRRVSIRHLSASMETDFLPRLVSRVRPSYVGGSGIAQA